MANKVEIVAQIRFALEQMSVQNAQHDFEHLCRYLARAKICSNVIPSTGPVQAGGDKGRDFETIHTYLSNSNIAQSSFIGLFTEEKCIFACSLEQNPDKNGGKIQEDVNKIVDSGIKVDRIYFFSSRDINIAKRIELQNWAEEQKKVKLEILDAQAISEMLSDNDVFWIASEFLRIPSELYPRPLEQEDWYGKILKEWREKEGTHYSFEEFEEIKSGARYVYKNDALKQDLPFWVKKLELFIADGVIPILKMKAIYEICVDGLVATGVLHGKEELVREYFKMIDEFDDSSSIEDAVILLSFISTASFLNAISIEEDELIAWKKNIDGKIANGLKGATNQNSICSLLEIRSFLTLNFATKRDPQKYVENFNKSIDDLQKIFEFLPKAPMFPLERLAGRISGYINILLENNIPVNINKLEEIAQKLDDEFLAERHGGFRAGESYKDRALIYLKNNETVQAINLLHKVKLKWFADETLKGALLAILILAECYQKTGMNFAGKYYALAAAHIAINSGKPELYQYFSRALNKAASCEYGAGAWVGYFELIESLTIARNMIMKDPLEITEDNELLSVIYQSSLIKYFVKRFSPDLTYLVEDKIKKMGQVIGNDITGALKLAEDSFGKLTDDQIWELLNDQMSNKPFNDIGGKRKVKWQALGVIWEISFLNDHRTNSVAEQFMAILQILQIEIADIDLHNVEGEIKIEIVAEQIDKPSFKRGYGDVDSFWVLRLPIYDHVDKKKMFEAQASYVAFAISMLYTFSFLPNKEFYSLLEEEFKEQLNAKTTIAQPYEVLFRTFIPEIKYNESQRQHFTTPFSDKTFCAATHPALSWKQSISPKYQKEEAERQIRNRYKNINEIIRKTLHEIKNKDFFKKVITELKQEGFLDWQILLAIMNRIVNYKVEQRIGRDASPAEMARVFKEIVDDGEEKEYIEIPESIFSKEAMKTQIDIGWAMILKTWKLEMHNEKINPEKIRNFLEKRFCIMMDDVEHDNMFDENS